MGYVSIFALLGGPLCWLFYFHIENKTFIYHLGSFKPSILTIIKLYRTKLEQSKLHC